MTRSGPSRAPELAGMVFFPACAAILGLAALLRLWHIADAPLWMDEAYTVLEARLPARAITFGSLDVHPPLFTLLEHGWLLLQSDPSFARVPAALVGIATVALMIAAVTDLHSRPAGLAAGALLAVSVAHVWHSQDARMYTLQLAGLLGAMWGCAGLTAERAARLRYGAIYILGGAIATYSQSVSLVFLAAINLGAGLAALRSHRRWPQLRALVCANLVLLALALPWLISMKALASTYTASGSREWREVPWTVRNVLGYPGLTRGVRRVADYGVVALIALSCMMALRRANRGTCWVVAAGLVAFPCAMIASTAVAGLVANRLFLPLVLPAAMALAIGAASIRRRGWGLAGIAGLVAVGLCADLAEQRIRRKIDNPVAATRWIDGEGYSNIPFVTCHFFLANDLSQVAEGHPIYFTVAGGSLLRFDAGMGATVVRGILWRHRTSPPDIDRALGGGHLVAPEAFRAPVVAAVDQPCGEADTRAVSRGLRRAGYVPFKHREVALAGPARAPYQDTYTAVSLYRRN